MNFVLSRSDNMMSIDNTAMTIDLSSMPGYMEVVTWDSNTGTGSIEYNDRRRVLEPIGDPAGWQGWINHWMTTAVPRGLLLHQAKLIKNDLVDSVYNYRRQLPITDTFWGLQWDASDESLAAMNAVVNQWDVALVFNQMPLSAHSSTVITGVSQHGQGVTGTWQFPSTAFPRINGMAAPAINWIPIGSTTEAGMTTEQMRTLIRLIEERRARLFRRRLDLHAYFNAQTNIQYVIDGDASSGM